MSTILILDQEQEGRETIRATLGIRTEWKLIEAASSREGIAHFDREPIDLIVLGTPLSEPHSDPFVERLRAQHSQTPIVLLTGSSERTLSVRGVFTTGAARFTIRDEGPGFDPNQISDPTEFENLAKFHGRGLFLIKAFMDEVSFNAQGNEIQLVKSATRPHPKSLSTA